jgi:DMSO reductase anchor subunit
MVALAAERQASVKPIGYTWSYMDTWSQNLTAIHRILTSVLMGGIAREQSQGADVQAATVFKCRMVHCTLVVHLFGAHAADRTLMLTQRAKDSIAIPESGRRCEWRDCCWWL